MKRIILTALAAVALTLGAVGAVSANPPADPPGQGECNHGNSQQSCRPDPQPSHGADCDEHGPKDGGVNEDHCQGEQPSASPTSSATPSDSPIPTEPPTPTPTASPSETPIPTASPTPTSSVTPSEPPTSSPTTTPVVDQPVPTAPATDIGPSGDGNLPDPINAILLVVLGAVAGASFVVGLRRL